MKVKIFKNMKKLFASFVFLALAFSAVASYKTIQKKKKKKTIPKKATIVNDTKIKSVLMGRAACFGTCPTYTIQVFESGLILYNGKHFVDKEGVYEKRVNPNDAILFLKEFNTLQPDTLHYMYETKIADLPGIYYFIDYPDSTKRVINADAGPRVLYEWARKFDDFAKFDNTWKKQSTEQIKK